MAENPHDLEKQIRGLGLTDLTASGEGSIVDKISQLKFDYDTGNSQALHAIEKTLKEYNKSLANIAGEGLVRTGLYKTDTLNAGFLPATITGFFNSATNERLFKFFTEDNNAFLYGFRRLNDGYTGYSCRIRRQYDLAQVDVRFDDNGIVSPTSQVDLAHTGFGTGLRPDEQTFSGFCKPNYLGTGFTSSEFNTVTVSKIYSQGKSQNFTGEFQLGNYTAGFGSAPETTMPSGESFQLDVNDVNSASYGNFIATSEYNGQSEWQLLKGTGVTVGSRTIMFPIYVKSRQFQEFQVMYPQNFGTGHPQGLRWVVRDRGNSEGMTNWSDVISYYLGRTTIGDFDLGQAYSSQVITLGANEISSNRPYDFTAWAVKDGTFSFGLGNGFDSSSTFVYYRNKINNQPIVATGKTKIFYDDGTNRLGMKFNAEGNASVLHNDGNFIALGSEASMGFVVGTDKTGENQTVFSQGEQEGVSIEGAGTAHDGAYLVYGLHFASSQYAWKGQFYDTNTDIKTSVGPMTPNSGRDTNTHFIQMHVSATASSSLEGNRGILEFDGVRQVGSIDTPDSSQAFLNDVTRIGARLGNGGVLTEGLDGTIYEMIFFSNDSQLDQDELNRYRPNVVDYHDITLQNE